MAQAGWSTMKSMEHQEYTHTWTINNFRHAMVVGRDKVTSSVFHIAGVPEEFYIEIEKIGSYGYTEITLNCVDSKTCETTRVAGKLTIMEDGQNLWSGQFGDPVELNFYCVKDHPCFYKDNEHSQLDCKKETPFTLVAPITVLRQLISLEGTVEEDKKDEKQSKIRDFAQFLEDPKFSDIVLNCDGQEFPCHKVILAGRWGKHNFLIIGQQFSALQCLKECLT